MASPYDDTPINSREAFVQFLHLIHKDLLSNPQEWENTTLESFLEAMGAYAQDIDGYYRNMKPDRDADKASWQTFADIIRGATMYE
jgi:hypothetical protein